MNLGNVLTVGVLVFGVPLNIYVTIRLWQLARATPQTRVLRERAITATAVLIVVAVFGFIFLNNDLVVPFFTTADTKILTRLTMLIVAIVPASYWLVLYR